MSRMKLNMIAVGIVILVTTGFALGFAIPGARKLTETRNRAEAEAAAAKAEQERMNDISALYASIVEMDASVRHFRERLPSERKFGEFLNSVSENLKRAEIDDFTVQPRPSVQLDESRLPASLSIAKGTLILPVQVSFEGTLAQLVEFQRRMEELPRLSHIESMKLVNDETRPGIINVELLLLTFCHPEEDRR